MRETRDQSPETKVGKRSEVRGQRGAAPAGGVAGANGQWPMASGLSPALRPLGLPQPVRVRADAAGLPLAVTLDERRGGAPLAVEQVEEVWRLAEAWWREAPVARTYYRLILAGGRPLTVFHDDKAGAGPGGWFAQRYTR